MCAHLGNGNVVCAHVFFFAWNEIPAKCQVNCLFFSNGWEQLLGRIEWFLRAHKLAQYVRIPRLEKKIADKNKRDHNTRKHSNFQGFGTEKWNHYRDKIILKHFIWESLQKFHYLFKRSLCSSAWTDDVLVHNFPSYSIF